MEEKLDIVLLSDRSQGLLQSKLFNSYNTEVYRKALLFPSVATLTLDLYLIILDAKQGGIKYDF